MHKTSRMPILDGHNDTLLKLGPDSGSSDGSFFVRGEGRHIDLPRAHEGNFAGGLFAIFAGSEPPEDEDSTRLPSL
jgi:membrane dipeptidase